MIAAAALGLVAGCQTTGERIASHGAAFASLDPTTQQAIRQGIVQPGFTPDMVYMALGKPIETALDSTGNGWWLYRYEPITAPNETIQSGYRRRIVYDPVSRTDNVIVEPIDEKAFPNLVPYTLRLTFANGRVAHVEKTRRW